MHSRAYGGLFASLLLLLMASGLSAAMAASPDQATSDRQAQRQARTAEMQQRLAREAQRLEIRASQQGPWGVYEAALVALMAQYGPQRPPRGVSSADQNPAAQLREAAQRTSQIAQKLTELADATSKLWAVLSPAQRAVLVEVLRASPMDGGGGPRHPPGPPLRDGNTPDDGGPPGPAFGGEFGPPGESGPEKCPRGRSGLGDGI